MDMIGFWFTVAISMLFPLAIMGVCVTAIVFGVKAFRRYEARADERLKLERENLHIHEQQMHAIKELNERLQKVEDFIKRAN